MSKWVVRRAIAADKEWVVKQTAAFIDYTQIGIPVDMTHLRGMFDAWVDNPAHYLLIAECDGVSKGVVAATLTPHFLNPAVSVFAEMMWWVPEEHRHSRAGLILLDALDKVGEAKANLIALATEAHSKVNGRTLEKRGYKLQELTHFRRV